MSVTSVEKDLDALTMTVTADLDATVERAWQLWADPRQFEQWWGPPDYPATVVDYDLRAGGRITLSSRPDYARVNPPRRALGRLAAWGRRPLGPGARFPLSGR